MLLPLLAAVRGLPGLVTIGSLGQEALMRQQIGDHDGSCYAYENTGSAAAPVWARKTDWEAGIADAGSYASPALADLDRENSAASRPCDGIP